MKYVHPKARYTAVLPEHLCAQINLFRILLWASCFLSIFDNLINWVQHYSHKSLENLWLKRPFKSRKKFIQTISAIYTMDDFKPATKVATCPGNNRKISIPVFLSFVDQILSLLHDPKTMTNDKIIKDYYIFTGKCKNDFWGPTIIDHKDSMVVPVSLYQHINISDITLSYIFKGPFSASA